jgi:hypothetical protein
LEDKILKIEQFYPQIAAHVFNYGQAEVEASTKPGGRISKLHSSLPNKKRAVVKDTKTLNENDDDSSLGELKRRMGELKTRLLKK